ncbi:MAG: DUF4258 domain-containing protein [Anaerolineales bacterium]|nr:DUF4258 domain-containing protein [Anaerolineales bacterium]
MHFERVVFRVHALQRMFERAVSYDDVIHVLKFGEVIEEYPEDHPHPSQLVLGWLNERPLHVVVATDGAGTVIVITVYEPKADRWNNEFTRRR